MEAQPATRRPDGLALEKKRPRAGSTAWRSRLLASEWLSRWTSGMSVLLACTVSSSMTTESDRPGEPASGQRRGDHQARWRIAHRRAHGGGAGGDACHERPGRGRGCLDTGEGVPGTQGLPRPPPRVRSDPGPKAESPIRAPGWIRRKLKAAWLVQKTRGSQNSMVL